MRNEVFMVYFSDVGMYYNCCVGHRLCVAFSYSSVAVVKGEFILNRNIIFIGLLFGRHSPSICLALAGACPN